MRHDRTKPVPAPDGYKWVVSRSMLTGAEFQLGLWREDAVVDRYGDESVEVAIPGSNRTASALMHGRPASGAYFDEPRQIRGASKRALRQFEGERARREMTASLLGEIS